MRMLHRVQLTTSVGIGTDCIGSCKSNYHMVATMTAPQISKNKNKQNTAFTFKSTHCKIHFVKYLILTPIIPDELLWWRPYGSWTYNYLCNRCLSPLRLWVVLDATLCDKVCLWLATGWWFSLGTLVSSTNKTDCCDITEILLKNHKPQVVVNPNTIWSRPPLETACRNLCVSYVSSYNPNSFITFLVLWQLTITGLCNITCI
jgi:hypothetical protein